MMYLGDYTEDSPNLIHKFTSRTLAGPAATLEGSPVISVYKGSETATEKTSAESYITLTPDFDGKTGLNHILIDLSGDAFFETGEDYQIVLTTGVVNGVTVDNEELASFSIQNRFDGAANIGTGSAGAVNYEATEDNASGAIIDGITKVGTPTGTFGNTANIDGSVLSIAAVGSDIDWVLGYDIGGGRAGVSIDVFANVNGNPDEMKVKVYNHNTSSWDIIATLDGSGGSSFQTINAALLNNHTGTGGEKGKVYIRFDTDSTTPSLLEIDHCIISAVDTSRSVGYLNGAVWVDSVNGTAGTENFFNGTADRPSASLADARIIADSVGLDIFEIAPGTTVTLGEEFDGYEFLGFNYTVVLNGQSVSGAGFIYAAISGNDSGSNALPTEYINCDMGDHTLGKHHLHACGLGGDIVLAEAGDYFWDQCYSLIAGLGAPSVDFEAAAETKSLSVRHASSGLEYKNFGNTGTHTGSLEGDGQIIFNANCAGGPGATLATRGHFPVTDYSGGAVTLSDDARYDVDQIAAAAGIGVGSVTRSTPALQIDGIPVGQAELFITIDSAGETPYVGPLMTLDDGTVEVRVDVGVTYYLWFSKHGAINPIKAQTWTVV